MPGARPRRSTASASFAHLFQPIKLEGDDDSSTSSDEARNGAGDTKKGKRKTVYVPEESSGSEFDAGNASGSRGGAEDDDDATISTEADDDIDLGSGVSNGGDTDVSGSVVGSPAPRGGKADRRRSRTNAAAAAGIRAPARARAHANVIVTGADREDGKDGPQGASQDLRSRAQVPRKHPLSGITNMYSFFGPLSTATPTRTFALPAAGETHAYLSEGVPTCTEKRLTDREIEEVLEQWTGNPFGVERTTVRDAGWSPGRYDPTSGAERQRWGGWYPEIRIANEDVLPVTDSALSEYLPLPSYPLRAQGVHTPLETDEAESGAHDAVDNTELEEDELPTPPAPFQTGSAGAAAGPSAGSRTSSLAAIGSVKLRLGKINATTTQQAEKEIELPRFAAVRLDEHIPRKPGHLFNAGAALKAVKWAPRADGPSDKEYLAVTTVTNPEAPLRHVSPSSGLPARSRSMIQLWSIPCNPARDELSYELPEVEDQQASRARMQLEVGFCIEGDVGEIAWCPRGGPAAPPPAPTEHGTGDGVPKEGTSQPQSKGKGKTKTKAKVQAAAVADEMQADSHVGTDINGASHLGVVAAVMASGALAFFALPKPSRIRSAHAATSSAPSAPLFVKLAPLFELRLQSSTIVSVAWGGHETVAVGCTDGTIAVWQVGDALRSAGRDVNARPTHLARAHSGVVRSLLFVPSPPPLLPNRSESDVDKPPTGLVTVGYDGVATLCDLRAPDLAVASLYQQRAPINSVTFCAVSGVVYTHDTEDRIKAVFLKPSILGSEGRIAVHRGPVWSLTASPHHGLVVSTSSDGTAILSSGVRALRKRRVRGHFTRKLFRFDFKRETGELRMWDNLDDEHRQALDASNFSRTAKKGTAAEAADPNDSSTAAWALEQGVLCSEWHSSMDRCALLATGTASGLGRVDWVEGTAQAVASAAFGGGRDRPAPTAT
ncbi:hypothetical protein JCM3774_001107 [Rhodotorula dairenensis]